MHPALKAALSIGLANMAWLYLSFYLGLHTSGIRAFQAVPLGWLLISTVGYFLALRAMRREDPEAGFADMMRRGATISVLCAVIAVIAQVGYYTLIHPGWQEFMMEETREHFTARGYDAQAVEAEVARARETFTLRVYAVQAALGALIIGLLTSAVVAFVLRRPREPASGAPA